MVASINEVSLSRYNWMAGDSPLWAIGGGIAPLFIYSTYIALSMSIHEQEKNLCRHDAPLSSPFANELLYVLDVLFDVRAGIVVGYALAIFECRQEVSKAFRKSLF